MALHQRIPLQMYIKIAECAKSHHILMRKKTKRIDSLDLTDIVCDTRVT